MLLDIFYLNVILDRLNAYYLIALKNKPHKTEDHLNTMITHEIYVDPKTLWNARRSLSAIT